MHSGSIIFVVPEDYGALVAAVEERGGRFEDVDEGSDPAEYLGDNVGRATSAVFEGSDDPIDDVAPALAALKAAGSPYFAITDSFTERSRGIRVEGTVVLNLTGSPDAEQRASYPWKDGEPEFNERTLRNAGFRTDAVDAMGRVFFPDVPAPRY